MLKFEKKENWKAPKYDMVRLLLNEPAGMARAHSPCSLSSQLLGDCVTEEYTWQRVLRELHCDMARALFQREDDV